MTVARAPLRFSLGGGGSDLPGYVENHGGFIVAAAIDQHVDVSVVDGINRTCSNERITEALDLLSMDGVVVDSTSSVPPGTGLGSSGSFTVALLCALHAHRGDEVTREHLAAEACRIEIDRLGEPIGKQDQYMAALGGIQSLTFARDGRVAHAAVALPDGVAQQLADSLVVYFTGVSRRSRDVLAAGIDVDEMHHIKALGREVHRALVAGDVDSYGEMLHEHWRSKRRHSDRVSNEALDAHYAAAREAGATGGKVMGAGGGGFFMFQVPAGRRRELAAAMSERGLDELPFRFDTEGVRVV